MRHREEVTVVEKWLKNYSAIPLKNENFQKILEFYLFECPCEISKYIKKEKRTTYKPVSTRGVALQQRGWIGGHLNSLLAQMKNTNSKQLTFQHFPAADDILSHAKSIEKNSLLADTEFEMIVMAERSDMPLTGAIFYYIRNALAHGSFSYKNHIYYFESFKDGKTKATIRLREKTLLEWIKDISLSPTELKQALKDKSKKKRHKVA